MSVLLGVSSATSTPRTGWDKETSGPRDKMTANLQCTTRWKLAHTQWKLAGNSNYKTKDWWHLSPSNTIPALQCLLYLNTDWLDWIDMPIDLTCLRLDWLERLDILEFAKTWLLEAIASKNVLVLLRPSIFDPFSLFDPIRVKISTFPLLCFMLYLTMRFMSLTKIQNSKTNSIFKLALKEVLWIEISSLS